MNLYGQDMDQTVMPSECGLGWTVHFSSARDFVGKAALLERTPAYTRWGLVLDTGAGMLRAHQTVESSCGEGLVTSGTFSPSLQASIALARLPLAVREDARVHVRIRDKLVAARVVNPPFVRYGKILIRPGESDEHS